MVLLFLYYTFILHQLPGFFQVWQLFFRKKELCRLLFTRCHREVFSYDALDILLESACYEYMKYMVGNNMILCPHDNWTAAYEQLKMMTEGDI